MADAKRRAPAAASREHLNATLTIVESHRIVSLLQKGTERLQLLSTLNYDSYDGGPGTGQEKEGGSGPVGESGVGAILQNQKEMECRYDELLTTTAKVKHNPLDPSLDLTCFLHINDEEQRKQQAELEKVSNNLKLYSKELKRQLKENPNDSNNWNKVVNGRTELTRMLQDVIRELQSTGATSGPGRKAGDDGLGGGYDDAGSQHSESQRSGRSNAGPSQASYEMFAVKVNDEQNEQIWADEIVKREKETNQNVKTLQNEVAVERHKKEQELEERQQQLSKLKKDVRSLRNLRTEDYERLKGEREAQAEAQAQRSKNRQRELREEIQNVEERIEIEKQVSRELSAHLLAKTKEVGHDTKSWSDKQNESTRREDEQLAYKNNEKKDLEVKLLEKKQELEEQEAKAKSNRVKCERDRERKDRAEELDRMRREASTRLQASFKGYMVRKDLKDGKKGKKKKGKK